MFISSNWESWYGVKNNNVYGYGILNTKKLIESTKRNVLIDKTFTEFCENEGVLLKFQEQVESASWNSGVKETFYVEYNTGDYYAQVIDQFGCKNMSDTISILSKLSPEKS